MVVPKSEPMGLSSFSNPCCLHQHFTCMKQEVGECSPTRGLSSEWGGGDSSRIVGALMRMSQVIKGIKLAESLVNVVVWRTNLNEQSSNRAFSLNCSIWPVAMPHFSDNYSVNHPESP